MDLAASDGSCILVFKMSFTIPMTSTGPFAVRFPAHLHDTLSAPLALITAGGAVHVVKEARGISSHRRSNETQGLP